MYPVNYSKETFMDYFVNIVYEHGLIAMFFLILIEYACFPISSEIVLPFSGAAASLEGISFFTIVPVSILAGLIGTSICYLIGRMGGTHLLEKIKIKFPRSKKGIESSYKKFEQWGTYAVCIGRVIPICRTYIAFIAGAAKQNYLTFLGYSAIGITIWNILLIGLGYLLQDNWAIVGSYYDQYKKIIIPLIFLLIVFLLVRFTSVKKLISRR